LFAGVAVVVHLKKKNEGMATELAVAGSECFFFREIIL
jgi:hypothetical protein